MSALRIAYVATGKADDVHEWSGLNAAIRSAIVGEGCHVTDVDQLGASYPLRLRLRKKMLAQFGATYALDRSPHAAARWSRIASARIASLEPIDAVVSTSTIPVSQLDGDVPLVLWADATFHSLRTTYPEYARYARASIEDGDRLERAALTRASLLCYASRWAAQDAVRFYGVNEDKVRVIEFGANTDSPFDNPGDAVEAAAARDWHTLQFAFIGVDWQRKGGALAVDIVRRLNADGLPSVLSIVGCDPPPEVAKLPFVRALGFLSKKSPADRARLHDVLRASHFVLMPTQAECFGLVFAEAAAFALPSISCDVGGVSSAIVDGQTGLLLAAGAGADAYCAAILQVVREPARYRAMCIGAFKHYCDRLNWRVAGARFVAELRSAVRRAAIAAP